MFVGMTYKDVGPSTTRPKDLRCFAGAGIADHHQLELDVRREVAVFSHG